MCVHMWNSWLLGALHVMILSHSAADELNVQSNGNNAAIVAVRILPRGGSLDECTHLWYHDVLWIKALSKMTLTHSHTHMFLAAAPPLPPFVCINRLKLLETNRPTSQEDGHMRGMKSITLLITAVTSHIETKRKKDLNHHKEEEED